MWLSHAPEMEVTAIGRYRNLKWHWFHALLKFCSDRDDSAPLIHMYMQFYEAQILTSTCSYKWRKASTVLVLIGDASFCIRRLAQRDWATLRIWIKTSVLTNLEQDPGKIQADQIEANLPNLCSGIQRQNISMVPRRMCDVYHGCLQKLYL